MSVLPFMTEDKELQIAHYLNLYLFQNVWNEGYRASRNNILPQLLTKRAINGGLAIYGEHLSLPNDNDPFYVFAASRTSMGALVWPKRLEHQWISTDDLVGNYGILLDVYHIHGKMLHKKHVHVYQIPNSHGYLVAINKRMYNKVLTPADLDGIRFTAYFDYDIQNSIEVFSYDVPTIDNTFGTRFQIWEKYKALQTTAVTERRPAVLFFINGEEVSNLPGAAAIPLGSCVDIQIDRNAYIDLELDLTESKNSAQFFSEMDECYKNIIHVPRTENPNNYVMTHNAFEIYVRKRAPEADGSYKGLYLHRCAERTVTNITHQDLGIPTYILDAYRDYLGTTEITLRIYWRRHEDANVLVRDKNYIDLLYSLQHKDDVIVGYLSGYYKHSKDLPFWLAAHLEKSAYVETFFDVKDIVTPENIHHYIEALGYYNTMFLLAKHVHRAVITEAYDGGYLFPKPLVYQGNPVAAIVYANGIKVPHKDIRLNNISDQYAAVGVNENWDALGTQLTVEFHRDGVQALYKIEPKRNQTELTIPATEYDIIEEISSETKTEKYDYESLTGCQRYTKETGNVARRNNGNGTYTLIFGPATYGKTYYVQPKPRTLYWSSEEPDDQIDIQQKLENGDPLFFNLTKRVKYESVNNTNAFCQKGERCLIWDTDSCMVFVNNRYLIRDIDYTIQDVSDRLGNVAMKILVIQNHSYLLQDEKNTLEIYCTSAVDENREYGYCAPRLVEIPEGSNPDIDQNDEAVVSAVIKDNRTVLYNDGTSIIHVNGYYTDAEVKGNFIIKDPSWKRDWKTANPVEVRTSVPYFVSDYLKKYHEDDDLSRIEAINRIYFNQDLRRVNIEVIEDPHLIYSIYTSAVLRDVLNKKNLALSYDPDLRRMHQQLEKYKYLADADLVYQELLDLQYVDIYPHYKQLIAPDIETYQLLMALCRATMPADPISNKKDIDLKHP